MNEDAFSGLKTATVKNVGPDGKEGLGQSSSLDEGKAVRNGQNHIVGSDRAVVVSTTANDQRQGHDTRGNQGVSVLDVGPNRANGDTKLTQSHACRLASVGDPIDRGRDDWVVDHAHLAEAG